MISDFHEKYKVTKLIGRGAFAKVYLAKHNQTKVKYAIKQFSKRKLQRKIKDARLLWNEI